MTVAIELELPDDLARFHLPAALADRLQALLDRQDEGTLLTLQEREEALALVDLSDLFTLLRLRTRPQTPVPN